MRKQSTFMRGFLGSSFLSAAVLLCALDFWMGTAQPLVTAPIANLQRSEPYLCAREYNHLPVAPDVVLLGSSVVVSPVLQAEAMHVKRPIPRMRHRQSAVASEALATAGIGTCSVFNFAVGGCMMSDAYLITKNVLCKNAQDKPRAIIYGVAPRDIQDNIMQHVGIPATETFQCFAAPDDALKVKSTIGMTWVKRLDLTIGRMSNLWRHKSDLVALANLKIKKGLEATLPWVAFEKRRVDGTRHVERGGMFFEEALGEPMVVPGYGLEYISRELTDQQYQYRYNPVSPKMNELQLGYLVKLIDICKRNDIALFVVNMPLSDHNRKLMPSGLYPFFVQSVSGVCRSRQVRFIDLGSCQFTADANFVDGVHLSCQQSQPFIQYLARQLSATHLASSVSRRQVATTGSAH